MKTILNIKIEPKLKAQLSKEASYQGRSLSNYINRILEARPGKPGPRIGPQN